MKRLNTCVIADTTFEVFSLNSKTYFFRGEAVGLYGFLFFHISVGVKMAEEIAREVEKTIKTTIKLADKLWRDVKVYAAKKGLKLTQVVEAALREYIKEEEPSKKGEE